MNSVLARFVKLCAGRIRNWGGVLTIAAFQIAPITMQRDDAGQLSLALGYGTGDFTQRLFVCFDKTWDRRVEHSTLSGIAEYISPGGKLHATVMAGNINTAVGPPRRFLAGPDDVPSFAAPFDGYVIGALIGTQFARQGPEWPAIGIQAGVISFPRPGGRSRLEPSFRLRVHEAENVYMQFDYLTVNIPGQIPMSSLGMGFGNPDRSARPAGNFALAIPRIWENRDTDRLVLAARGEFSLPIGKRADITLGGVLGGGSLQHISGGLRLLSRSRTESPPPNQRR